MANDAIKAAVAANRDVPAAPPGPFQDCRDVIHISVFFDGTGNNKDVDDGSKRWSNPARMWRAAEMAAPRGTPIYPIYISGVGTLYNGPVNGVKDATLVWLEDKAEGMGFGGGGDRRMEHGTDNVNARLRDVLIGNAQRAGGDLKKYADQSQGKSFAEVNGALGKHRLIKMINLSVFGFSRGAALARAFSNRVLKECKQAGDDLTYQGHPIRINFVGIFDTVASFGVPSQNVQYPWNERDLIVSPKVERCVHYVAGHELRFAFPVDLIRQNGQLVGNWEEVTYPGVHSDVGGGYEPMAQAIDNNYARIPMRDMMREAIGCGVRMMGYQEIKSTNFPLFQERFECKPETQAAYEGYMRAWGSATGTIEQQAKRHRQLLYTGYGTMHRLGMENPGDRQRKEDWIKFIGPKGMAWEVSKYRKAAKLGSVVRWANPANTYAYMVKPEQWQLTAWDSNAPDGVVAFIAKYVHDSKVDFIANLGDPFSYFKARGIAESTRSIWQESGDWIHDKSQKISAAAESTYNAGGHQVSKAADATAQAAHDAAVAAQRKADELSAFAKRKAQEAADLARSTYEAGKQEAAKAAEATARAAREAADAAQREATALADAAQRKAKQAGEAVSNTAHDAAEGVERYVEAGVTWVKQTAQAVTQKVSSYTNR